MQLASAQANDAAKQAGAEYATWAGLDVQRVLRGWRGTASEDRADRPSSPTDVRTFSPLFTPRGGYCRYTPPDPYSADYDGSDDARPASAPAPASWAVAIPTPTLRRLREVGPGRRRRTRRSPTPASQTQTAQIARAPPLYAAVGTAAAVVLGTALATVLSTTATGARAVDLHRRDPNREIVGGAAIGTVARRGRHRRCGPDHHPGDRHRGARGHPSLRERRAARQDRRARRQRPHDGHRPSDADRHDRRVRPRCSPCSSGRRCRGRGTTSPATTR